jgi:RND family efflux transporter MFP subunit
MKSTFAPALRGPKARVALVVVALGLIVGYLVWRPAPAPVAVAQPAKKAAARPALTVQLVSPQREEWPLLLPANGSVLAWQEAVIGPELANYRLTEVHVQVGDRVKKGQLLARIASDTVASEVAEAKASVAELEASAAEAKGNAERARELRARGFYSAQLNNQYQTAERTAQARLAAARSRLEAAELKLGKTTVLAPDDGVISASAATVGSLTQPEQELFRLIRGGRLEWRAEVTSADLAKLRPGLSAQLMGPNGETVRGTVRTVAPSVDAETRNGLVYVDLPSSAAVRSGMFARGHFEIARQPALTVPQSALVLREGFAYVFRLEGEDRVALTKVALGRRQGERVEIVAGLPEGARVVASGGGFLADGDSVKVLAGG